LDIGGGSAPVQSAPVQAAPVPQQAALGQAAPMSGLLGDIFGIPSAPSPGYVSPKVLWLPAIKGKGLEISGTFSRKYCALFFCHPSF